MPPGCFCGDSGGLSQRNSPLTVSQVLAMAAHGGGELGGGKSARAGERPRSSGAGATRTGGGERPSPVVVARGTSNSIGESEGLLAVSFFSSLCNFFFFCLDENENKGIR